MSIFTLEYEGNISQEGYSTIDKAIKHLKEQGYKQEFGWLFSDACNNQCKIKEIKIT